MINEDLSDRDASSIGKWIRKREEVECCHVKMRILVMVQRVLSIEYHTYEECEVDGFLPKPLEGSKLIPSVEKAASQYVESVRIDERNMAMEAVLAEAAEEGAIEDAPGSEEQKPLIDQTPANASIQKSKQKSASNRKRKNIKKKKTESKASSQRSYLSQKGKRQDPITYESMFQYDENTSFPYAILHNGSNESTPESPFSQQTPWCNLIVCQDVFDTYERFKIFFLPMVARYKGMRILLWNYPGQAFTSFTDEANLNNKYHADCLAKLLEYLQSSDKRNFSLDQPHFLLAHGSGAAIATYFAAAYHSTMLKGLILVNGLSHVDSHYASVFHDCRNVFSCSPESRPDLPVYFYARFLFSPSYLTKTSSSLALNVYTAVYNPITLNGRKRLCQGVLNHIDTRSLLKEIASPIVSIHGDNATLVRALHATEFLNGRRSCPSIPQALRGGNRTSIVIMQGGHELFQEKKDQISLLVEQILTGYHDKIRIPPNPTVNPFDTHPLVEKDANAHHSEKEQHRKKTKSYEDKFIDNVLKDSRGDQSSWDMYQEEIMTEHESNSQNKPPAQSNVMKNAQQNEKDAKANKEFDPNEYPEVKEYMAWRIKRHKKRLAALDRSARIIQCALRCFMAKTMMGRLRKEMSAMMIQRISRGIFGRDVFRMMKKELWAAQFVQRTLRGHNGRCISYNKRLEKKAQINLSRMMRGLATRLRFRSVLKRRESSATRIQCIWRMNAAIVSKKYHRRRRDASTSIQRLVRGCRGRKKALLERDKYIFSRSQNSGIELGRQMLAEHKLLATKIQSEISLLNQEKGTIEKQIEFHLTEISNFERNVSLLEKKMHQMNKFEGDAFGVLADTKQNEHREEKRLMDEEFSKTLVKISDRKAKLEKLEATFEQLMRNRREKFGQLKNLETKLAVLLSAQDSALEGIRKKQEQQTDSVSLPLNPQSAPQQIPSLPPSDDRRASMPVVNNAAVNLQPRGDGFVTSPYYSGPTEKEKLQAAQLIDSTETMMKFGFMSMSLTYFSSLNMMRAMQRVAVTDVPSSSALSAGTPQSDHRSSSAIPNQNFDKSSAVRVESWSINDVSKWLTSISLSQYQTAFKEGAVDGSFLIELTDDDLRNTLGVEHRLHRKKILFSIRCLKNYADAQSSHFSPTKQTRPQHYSVSGSKSATQMSPNSTVYDESLISTAPYSISERQYESVAESPAKSFSVLDIMSPKKSEKVRVGVSSLMLLVDNIHFTLCNCFALFNSTKFHCVILIN